MHMQTVADIDLLGINEASLSVRGAPRGTLKILGKSFFKAMFKAFLVSLAVCCSGYCLSGILHGF